MDHANLLCTISSLVYALGKTSTSTAYLRPTLAHLGVLTLDVSEQWLKESKDHSTLTHNLANESDGEHNLQNFMFSFQL